MRITEEALVQETNSLLNNSVTTQHKQLKEIYNSMFLIRLGYVPNYIIGATGAITLI